MVSHLSTVCDCAGACATSRGRAESKLFDFLFSLLRSRKRIEIVCGSGEGSPRAAGGRFRALEQVELGGKLYLGVVIRDAA